MCIMRIIKKIKFKTKLVIFISLLNIFILLLSYLYFFYLKIKRETFITKKNLTEIANFLKNDEELKESLFFKKNVEIIEEKSKKLAKYFVEADLIVVIDRENIRYSHIDQTKIGKSFGNFINWNLLLNKGGYFCTTKGLSGITFRRFEPILYKNKVIGAVMVGKYYFLIQKQKIIIFKNLLLIFLISSISSIILSSILANLVKRNLLGLEPEEIKRLYLEEKLICDHIESGLIALNNKYEIIKINKMYHKICTDINPKIFVQELEKYINFPKIDSIEITVHKKAFLIKILTLQINSNNHGKILLIKKQSDEMAYARKISGVDNIINGMRANIHEFKNKLHVILGLINLKKLDLAKTYILELQAKNEYDFEKYKNIKSSFLKAILLGKESICEEKKIKFLLDLKSNLSLVKPQSIIEDVSIIVGNLIENSIESFNYINKTNKFIKVKISELNKKIFIEVTDNGVKITDDVYQKMLDYGFSTKGENRGLGLHLVKEKLKLYNGKISIDKNKKLFKIEMEIE